MADEPAAPQENPEDTPQPEVSAPEGTPEQSDHDYEKRYNDLRPQFDRTTQRVAELEPYEAVVRGLQARDPEVVQQVLDHLNLEMQQDEPEPTEYDPVSELSQQVAELQQQFGLSQQQAEQQAIQEQQMAHMNQALEAREAELGSQFTQEEIDLLVAHAVANPTQDGWPDMESALQVYDQVQKDHQQQWAATKNTSIPANGREGVEALDLDANHGDRVARMTAQLEADQASS